MSVDGDDEDFTYQSQADTVLDADTYDDLGSVSSMVTDQWADQNPGDSVVSDRKQLATRRPQKYKEQILQQSSACYEY